MRDQCESRPWATPDTNNLPTQIICHTRQWEFWITNIWGLHRLPHRLMKKIISDCLMKQPWNWVVLHVVYFKPVFICVICDLSSFKIFHVFHSGWCILKCSYNHLSCLIVYSPAGDIKLVRLHAKPYSPDGTAGTPVVSQPEPLQHHLASML